MQLILFKSDNLRKLRFIILGENEAKWESETVFE